MNGQRAVAAARLVGKGAGQALGIGQCQRAGLEGGHSRRSGARDVAGEQRVIDVKKQRQQRQHLLLTAGESFHGTGQAPLVEVQEALAQLVEDFAVDALIEVGANFVGVIHRKLKPAVRKATASLAALRL